MSALPYIATATGIRLTVRLTPRASRSGLDGIVTGADGKAMLHIRVAAPPVEGAANAALIAFVAAALGVRKSDISIISGAWGLTASPPSDPPARQYDRSACLETAASGRAGPRTSRCAQGLRIRRCAVRFGSSREVRVPRAKITAHERIDPTAIDVLRRSDMRRFWYR